MSEITFIDWPKGQDGETIYPGRRVVWRGSHGFVSSVRTDTDPPSAHVHIDRGAIYCAAVAELSAEAFQ